MRKFKIIILILAGLINCSIAFAQINETFAKAAEVVLRVKCERTSAVCDKYCQQKVKLLKVLKNDSEYTFPENIDLFYRSTEKGIPLGSSTVYLEKYTPTRNDLWKLLGGKRETGISHYTIIKVSLPLVIAEAFMKELGAKEAAMDMMVEEKYDLTNYELPDGRVVSIVSEKIDGNWFIESINICINPNKPKLYRTWENIEELE